MKLYIEVFKLLFKKFVLKKNNGIVIKDFASKMGIVYIKMAQMLATQNYGNLFTEEDRQMLTSICDDCNQIDYEEIEKILKQEYGDLNNIFSFIDHKPVGSASVSQVHRAILKSGEEVVIKVKRKDITKNIDEDIKRIRNIVHRFGRFVKFGNFIGGDHALDLYLDWISQETDFNHEVENIKIYQSFADSVNGKVRDTKIIKVPKLYDEYCTDNVIVMEFIKAKTINQMELTDENKENIVKALNSYIKLSFWAMFNGKQIVFHGDPHSGNICIDDEANICFLDMGLLCVLSDSDAKLCLKFFLSAYSGNYDKLYQMISEYGNMNEREKQSFKEDCKNYCKEVKEKDVSYYFIDMMNICLKYEIDPPNFLFSMGKTFVCINGISNFSNNRCTASELLQEQTIEFMLKRSINDLEDIIIDSLEILPNTLENTLEYGLINTISKLASNNNLIKDIKKYKENLGEIKNLIKTFYLDNDEDKKYKVKQKNKYI